MAEQQRRQDKIQVGWGGGGWGGLARQGIARERPEFFPFPGVQHQGGEQKGEGEKHFAKPSQEMSTLGERCRIPLWPCKEPILEEGTGLDNTPPTYTLDCSLIGASKSRLQDWPEALGAKGPAISDYSALLSLGQTSPKTTPPLATAELDDTEPQQSC